MEIDRRTERRREGGCINVGKVGWRNEKGGTINERDKRIRVTKRRNELKEGQK